ncbi:MAG TPA: NAD-dependent epimerase/dehydratase family protein [Bacteroidia bacterium]|nr:NAD-dependent epimerase/dehydratase family protein [Bacteroidia bacterium]
MEVLLTGATGFLGAHVAAGLLERGYSIKALRRSTSSLDEFYYILKMRGIYDKLIHKINWRECNLLDTYTLAEEIKGVEKIYHCAAIVSFWNRRREEMMHANVQGTANIVNCALQAGAKKLCYASSIAALGREKDGDRIDENTPWRDSKYNTHYAISKYLAEMEVWRGQEEGLDTVIVNPGIIIGEGSWDKGSCRLVNTAAKGLSFYTRGTNGYVDVQDVARAMMDLMESNISGERFILVEGNIPFKEFFTQLSKEFGKPSPRIPVGRVLAQLARLLYGVKSLASGKEPLVTRETARNSQKGFNYINDKIKRELGFEFTPMDETIKRVCAAYKNYGK